MPNAENALGVRINQQFVVTPPDGRV